MKFTVTVPVTVEVDIDIDNQIVNRKYVEEDIRFAIEAVILNDATGEEIVETVTDFSGWCVKGLSVTVESVKDNEEVG